MTEPKETVGPQALDALLGNPAVSSIRIHGRARWLVKRQGQWQRTNLAFADDNWLSGVFAHLRTNQEGDSPGRGQLLRESVLSSQTRKPVAIDAVMPGGWRVRVWLRPVAVDGPMLLLDRLPEQLPGIEGLLNGRFLAPEMRLLLEAAVKSRLNIVISGGVQAGKTTLLNALCSFVPPQERLILIEDRQELALSQPNVIHLQPRRRTGPEDEALVELVVLAATLLADRIILGDCRGPEAAELVRALTQAHRGSLTCVLARSPNSALAQLERRLLLAEARPEVQQVRERIAAVVQLIVQVDRLAGDVLKVTSITEVAQAEPERIVTRELFRFESAGVNQEFRTYGRFLALGVRPDFLPRLEQSGIQLPPNFFAPRVLGGSDVSKPPEKTAPRREGLPARKEGGAGSWLQRLLRRHG
jgi:pilus assembly protein CpaF